MLLGHLAVSGQGDAVNYQLTQNTQMDLTIKVFFCLPGCSQDQTCASSMVLLVKHQYELTCKQIDRKPNVLNYQPSLVGIA